MDLCRSLDLNVKGFLDDTKDKDARVEGVSVLGGTSLIGDPSMIEGHVFVVAIGNNLARRRFAEQIRGVGGELVTLVHPNCDISQSAVIGTGTVLIGGNLVFTGVRIGADVLIDPDTTVGADSVVEDGAYLCPGCHFGARVTLKEECFLGIGAVAAPETIVGRRAVVGAGAVVTRDVPPGALAVGNPARVIGDANLDETSPYPARGSGSRSRTVP